MLQLEPFVYKKAVADETTFWWVWCDRDAQNDNELNDKGFLKGRTISTVDTPTVTGITVNTLAVNSETQKYKGITYPIGTLVSGKISGGTAGTSYTIPCVVTLSDSDVKSKDLKIEVI